MVAQQFLCSVALCLAWLPCGESWVAKPREGFVKGPGSPDLGKAWLPCPEADFRKSFDGHLLFMEAEIDCKLQSDSS